MRIRYDEELGTIEMDGVILSAQVLREIVNPDKRLLFRFERKDGVVYATVHDERTVLWLDAGESMPTAEIGITDEKLNGGS
jgi:hypothetical protein